MVSANTRASSTRSGYSSPQITAAAAASAESTKSNGPESSSKTLLDKWLEPPVQSKASFQEAGLMRHGVVENMAPLGTLPKGAAARKGQDGMPRPRIILKKKEVAERAETPKPAAKDLSTVATPPTPAAAEAPAAEDGESNDDDGMAAADDGVAVPAVSVQSTQPSPVRHSLPAAKENDGEHEPRQSNARIKVNTRKGNARQSTGAAQVVGATTPTSKSARQVSTPSAGNVGNANGGGVNGGNVNSTLVATPSPAAPAAEPKEVDPEVVLRVGEVVKIAITEALNHFRYCTAWALRQLYDENTTNPHIMDVLDQIYHQTAGPEIAAEFYRLVHEKKKEGKRDNKACYSFVPPSTNSRFPPHKPKEAPYGHLVTLQIPKPAPEVVDPVPSNNNDAGNTGSVAISGDQQVARADADGHISKKQRLGRSGAAHKKTPSKGRMAANGATATPSTRGRRRTGSRDSSISSLSSAPSDLGEEADVFDEDADENEDANENENEKGSFSAHALNASPLASRRARTRNRTSAAHQQLAAQSADRSVKRAARASAAAAEAGAASSPTPTGAADAGAADAAAPSGGAVAGAEPSTTRTRAAAQPITGRRKSAAQGKKTGKAPSSTPTSATPTPTPAPPTPTHAASNSPPSAAANDINNNTTTSHQTPADDAQPGPRIPASTTAKPAPAAGHLPATRKGGRNREPRDQGNKASSPAPAMVSNGKFDSKYPPFNPEDDPNWQMRQDARKKTETAVDVRESSARLEEAPRTARTPQQPPPQQQLRSHQQRLRQQEEDRASSPAASTPAVPAATSNAAATPSGVQLRRPRAAHQQALRSTRSSLKRPHEEVDDDFAAATASPTPSLFPPPPFNAATPASGVNSRAGTPAPRPAKKARTGLRVKNSPMKRKTGPSAGLPRPSGERSSPAANGVPSNVDDNDDYCASCSGNGELVCCETCTRSFHFRCVDPPLLEPNLPDEWYCNVCLSDRNPAAMMHPRGTFRHLISDLNAKNSSAFALPGDIKEFFSGVQTGPDGEYEDIPLPVPKTRKRGYEEAPDFFRVRDADGGPVLCHLCLAPTAANRAIIPCSVCGLWWHLDCLDPPMANPPVLRTWKCPAHVDDILHDLPGMLAPAHRRRQIKGAAPVRPAYSRGLRNHGFIEVEDEPNEDDSDTPATPTYYGQTFHLSGKGIVLDFVSRVNRVNRAEDLQNLIATRSAPVVNVPLLEAPVVAQDTQSSTLQDPRHVERALAGHNISSVAEASSSGFARDNVGVLIDALLEGADDNVVSLMSRSNALSISQGRGLNADDKVGLKAMLARMKHLQGEIEAMIGRDDVPASPAAANDRGQDAPSIMADSPAAVPQLTEGTEKSTPEAEDIPVVTPVTEPEPASPVKESSRYDDVEMTDPTADVHGEDGTESLSTAHPVAALPAAAPVAQRLNTPPSSGDSPRAKVPAAPVSGDSEDVFDKDVSPAQDKSAPLPNGDQSEMDHAEPNTDGMNVD